MQAYERLILVRSLKRIALGAGAILVLLAGVRLAWGWEAEMRLRAAQKTIKQQHFHLEQDALEGQQVPDNQNAALAIIQAIRTRKFNTPDLPGQFGEGERPFFGRWYFRSPDRLKQALAANRESLAWIDRAVAMPGAKWPALEPTSDHDLTGDDFVEAIFELRGLLRGAADQAHRDQDDLTGMQYLERTLTISRVLEAYPALTAQSWAATMRSEAAQQMESWIPTMDLHGQTGIAARRMMLHLIAAADAPDEIPAAFEQETMEYREDQLHDMPALSRWWIRPLVTDAFARRLKLQLDLLPIARARNWQEAEKMPPPKETKHSNLNQLVYAMSAPDGDVYEAVRSRFRAQSDARAVAILLAASISKAQTGSYPKTAESLVPAYLANVPVDPFSEQGQLLHYRLDPEGPTVWSVGEDGKNDNAAFLPPGSLTGWGGSGGMGGAGAGGSGGTVASRMARGYRPGFRIGGGYFWGFRRRYAQPDIVYGAAWEKAIASMTMP